VLEDIPEYSRNYLKAVTDKFFIEAFILPLPSIGTEEMIKTVAGKILQSANGAMEIRLL
jgi:hypothetical protein